MSDPAVFVSVLIVLFAIIGVCVCIKTLKYIAELREAYEGV
jgi:hypothetical protein